MIHSFLVLSYFTIAPGKTIVFYVRTQTCPFLAVWLWTGHLNLPASVKWGFETQLTLTFLPALQVHSPPTSRNTCYWTVPGLLIEANIRLSVSEGKKEGKEEKQTRSSGENATQLYFEEERVGTVNSSILSKIKSQIWLRDIKDAL